MAPGDLHLFDNQRVLHGRTAFDPLPAYAISAVLGQSRRVSQYPATLAARFNHSAQSLTMAGGALG
ncbi:MAG: hypothetical protein CM1200mP18_06900 [Gammaproteobacteria bacterium]|nr:MAG: hypothetical protein CM1200mP18_06900 [Gammaproteobacteria bacterium]